MSWPDEASQVLRKSVASWLLVTGVDSDFVHFAMARVGLLVGLCAAIPGN